MRTLTLLISLLLLSHAGSPLAAAEVHALASDPGHRQVAVGPFDHIFSHVVDGAAWKTTFILTNLGSTTVNFVMFFYTDDGKSQVLPIAGLGDSQGVSGSIQAKGSLTLETAGTSAQLKQGSAFFMCLDRPYDQSGAQAIAASVGGMAIFSLRVPGKPDVEAVVPASSLNDSQLMFPFDNTNGFVTSVALINGDLAANTITVVMRDRNGTVIGQDAFTLASTNKTAFALNDKYPQTVAKRGTLEVSTTGVALGGLGLRFGPNGSITSMHPFAVPANAPAQPSSGSVPANGTTPTCAALEGARIFAYDGQYLGKLTTNTYATEAIGNTYGNYGSPYSSISIYNTYGKYGSAYSQVSAFNTLATTPPVIYIGDTGVAYLTVNQTKTPRIDPNYLPVCRFRL